MLRILCVILFSLSANAAEVSEALKIKFKENKTQDILLYFSDQPDLRSAENIVDRNSRVKNVVKKLLENSEDSQKPVVQFLKNIKKPFRNYFVANAILVEKASPAMVELLGEFPGVKEIGLNVTSELKLPFPKLPLPEEPDQKGKKIGVPPHISLINVEKVWDEMGVTGKGIVVANQDTGVLWNHNALIRQYRGNQNGSINHDYNWHDGIVHDPCSSGGAEPCDDKDHGTHTIGTIVGADTNGNRPGVAPDAKWISCRNMKEGVGTIASYMECFDFFLAPHPIGGSPEKEGDPRLAPHIVNNSWSCPKSEGCTGSEFAPVITAYRAAGIMLVAAAGNNGPNCGSVSNQPGIYAGDILAIGSYNSYQSKIAFFSGRGPSPLNRQLAPNLIAPGAYVKSTMASGINDFDDKAGTSMSAPQVAGVVALLWSHRPELIGQIDATIDIVQKSATPMTGEESCQGFPSGKSPNAVYGYGMLNAYEALNTN